MHSQPLSTCLAEFQPIEDKLRASIENWRRETINEVNQSADQSTRTLDAHIHTYRSHSDEESWNLVNASTNREFLPNQLEKLQIEYGRPPADLHLVRHHDRGPMLELETRNSTREQVSISCTSQVATQECGVYVPQTALGEYLIREPTAKSSVGSYWAIGGSSEYLLVQEYETNQLTLFDRHGTRAASMTWHYNLV
ncbi:unnamed protein product, partial [Didymodactylos carnosus]